MSGSLIEGLLGRHGRDAQPSLLKINAFRDLVHQGMSQHEAMQQAGLGPDEISSLVGSGEIGQDQGLNGANGNSVTDNATDASARADSAYGQGADPTTGSATAGNTSEASTYGAAAQDAGPRFELGLVPNLVNRLLSGGETARYGGVQNQSPGAMIERLFGDSALRNDGVQNLNTTAQKVLASADTTASSLVQGPANTGREGALQSTRADTAAVLAGPDRQPNPGAVSAHASGASSLANQAAPQGAVLAGQQAAALAQQAERAPADAALAQNFRQGEVVPAAVARDGGNTVQTGDRNLAAQQQLPLQTTPTLPGRADPSPAQVAAQLAGTTMAASVLGNVLPSQVAPPALAMAQSPDTAAAQARDTSVLQPAGHTAAGNLRRDLRPGTQASHKPVDWMLALMPGHARRRGLRSEDESTSTHWMFWTLTTVAYGALALAVVAMMSGGGGQGLLDPSGAPSYGAYALMVGGAASIAAWFVGRRLYK